MLTPEIIAHAEKVAGIRLTEAERELLLEGLNRQLEHYETLRKLEIPNEIPPALSFHARLPGDVPHTTERPLKPPATPAVKRPAHLDTVAFWPVTKLAELVHTRQISSVGLTQFYLDRLKRHAPALECVITMTEELALRQAEIADAEIARGHYRGPLHGIPWGAKDLLAVRGYPTTWGAMPYREQVFDMDAAVVERLHQAGAVLTAKLTLGALAWGDVWFGGKTRNPWNLEEGSSGSSAGSSAATAAGLTGFTIGSETWGSIVSPCTHCGVTGLRPTFGRVSRYGAMALSWSMDKLGPICRSVEDCALVFNAIYGPDGRDETVVDRPFAWEPEMIPEQTRIGYLRADIEAERENSAWRENDLAVLSQLQDLGFRLEETALPEFPANALGFILSAEAAAAFDMLTLSDRDDELVRQGQDSWPNVFRQARFIPAVEYIQANRARTLLMRDIQPLFEQFDVIVAPSFEGNSLLVTNLTGHPTVVVPNGFDAKGIPTSICLIGPLFGEAETLAVAKAYQEATDFHHQHPEFP